MKYDVVSAYPTYSVFGRLLLFKYTLNKKLYRNYSSNKLFFKPRISHNYLAVYVQNSTTKTNSKLTGFLTSQLFNQLLLST